MTGTYRPGHGFDGGDPRMALARALMGQGASTAPVQSPLEGLARALQGGVGGFVGHRARQGDQEGMSAALAALSDQSMDPQARLAAADAGYTKANPGGNNPIPGMRMSQLVQSMMPKGPLKMGATDRLVDPATGKEIISAQSDAYEPYLENGVQVGQKNTRTGKVDYMPAGLNDKWEPDTRGGISGQINRRTGEWKPADMRPQTTVSNTVRLPPQETKIQEYHAKQYTELEEGAKQANQMNVRLDRLGGLLDQVNTGKFAGTALEFKRAAKAAGIDLEALGIKDDVPAAEAARALSNEIALQLRNPAGGAGMPGAMSDQDRQFLQSMVPGIEATPEGRKMMIETSKKLNQRAIDVAKQGRAYLAKNKQFDPNFYNELQTWADANPLFANVSRETPDPSKWQPVPIPGEMKPPANPYEAKSDQEILEDLRRRGLLK